MTRLRVPRQTCGFLGIPLPGDAIMHTRRRLRVFVVGYLMGVSRPVLGFFARSGCVSTKVPSGQQASLEACLPERP